MIPKTRSARDLRVRFGWVVLAAAALAAAGCSTANSPGDGGSGGNVNHIAAPGTSVPGWFVLPTGGSHGSTATLNYIANGGSSSCAQCHGADLAGGISKVSCFANPAGCHHGPIPNWFGPAVHGAAAKKAPGNSGLASCQICHGNNFSGGGAQVACGDCHGVPAPHPALPWRGPTYTHVDTNTANAPVCAKCHYPGSPNNPAGHPATPAPAGTAPGCFNSTLCHGAAGAPHPVGSTWVATSPAVQPHGNSAKATPGAAAGFSYCQVCHGTGTDFAGGSSGVSCYPCHGASSPHPSQWRTGNTYVHTTTATGNAPVCAFCHTAGANSPIPPPPAPAPGSQPGCFNNTLCHGAVGAPHPVGGLWFAFPPEPQVHGNAAKATPGAAAGFSYCQVCHGTGTDFAGGSSGVSCYATCHLASSPHPVQWRTGNTYVHTTTASGNAPVCAFCHTAGANSPIPPPPAPAPGSQPDCFNNTLCHGAVGAPHPVPYNDNSHYTVASATFPGNCSVCHDVSGTSTKAGPVCQTCHVAASPLTALNCTSCHANPPVGSSYPDIAGKHSKHNALAGVTGACGTCHGGFNSGSQAHYDRANARPGKNALNVPPGDVAIVSTFNAKTGTASFSNTALTCANVSCHGGNAPNWQTGAINVATQCTSCHAAGTGQFNGYSSGRHSLHSSEGIACTECHDMSVATNNKPGVVNHFLFLGTPWAEGPAKDTFRNSTGTVVYTPTSAGTGNCNGICHTVSHGFSW